jgi:SAM-dependent methyltransferase
MGGMAQRGESVSFERAAGFYDSTRVLPPDAAAAQTRLLAESLAGAPGPVLEIGIGTGRVALPLVAAGVPLVGVDLSPAMLARLRAKDPAVPVVVGDATRLPVADRTVGATLLAHVLHLVADWRMVVAEVERVLRPGGVLLATRGATQEGIGAQVQAVARDVAGWSLPEGRLDDLTPLDEALAGRGADVAVLPEVPVNRDRSAAEMIDALAANQFSWTWDFTDEQRADAAAAARAYVESTYGDPATVVVPATPIVWHRYRFAG